MKVSSSVKEFIVLVLVIITAVVGIIVLNKMAQDTAARSIDVQIYNLEKQVKKLKLEKELKELEKKNEN
jgi:hypothetical protein